MADSSPPEVVLDCEAGRRMGCASFCCRLLVRLAPGEKPPTGKLPAERFVPKRDDGLCEHFDAASGRCLVWHKRPEICRKYDCNEHELLQVVLREGFTTLSALVTSQARIPAECRRFVPYIKTGA
ncbi:MAG: hypothetical protein H6840_08025 [Planctomycetes bacterium]|nr:hypothetical protein [Planctomycetota bacterium]